MASVVELWLWASLHKLQPRPSSVTPALCCRHEAAVMTFSRSVLVHLALAVAHALSQGVVQVCGHRSGSSRGLPLSTRRSGSWSLRRAWQTCSGDRAAERQMQSHTARDDASTDEAQSPKAAFHRACILADHRHTTLHAKRVQH